jgi:hypothetical protein
MGQKQQIVVIITTKRTSAEDKFTVNEFRSEYKGYEYERVDAFQYYPLTWEAIRNSRPMGTPALLATANALHKDSS